MKKLIFLLFFFSYAFAQNLVVNPGFDTSYACPTGFGELAQLTNYANGYDCLNNHPSLFDTCAFGTTGVALPNSGFGGMNALPGSPNPDVPSYPSCAGLAISVDPLVLDRSVLSGQLTQPLIPGQSYEISFWIHFGRATCWSLANIGIRFTENFYDTDSGLSHVLDSWVHVGTGLERVDSWQKREFTFTPTKPYKYFSLGNFDPPNAMIGQQEPSSCVPLSYQFVSGYYIDDLCVSPLGTNECHTPTYITDSKAPKSNVTLFPNPIKAGEELIVKIEAQSPHDEIPFIIYNATGKIILSGKTPYKKELSSDFARGIYFLKLELDNTVIKIAVF